MLQHPKLDGYNFFKYCPRCGTPYETHLKLNCQVCGFIFYQNSKPTSSGILFNNGRIVLVERAVEPNKGYLDVPGGFLEDGEHPITGLFRELNEELGISNCSDFSPIFLGIYPSTYFQHYNQSILNIAYILNISNFELNASKAADDIASFEVCTVDKALNSKLAFPWITSALLDVKSLKEKKILNFI